MAGRGGRGRGRGKGISFNVETLGFGRGEALPSPILQPPPVYPIAQFKAVPLETGEEHTYLLALKDELHTAMKESVFYIRPAEKKQEIERYSDRYQNSLQRQQGWEPDWDRLPAELQPKRKRKIKPAVIKKKTRIVLDEINQQFELLAEKEDKAGEDGAEVEEVEEDEEAKKAKNEEEDEEELEIFDEDDLEEETDYNMTYFDNGENDDDDDDVDEGPVY